MVMYQGHEGELYTVGEYPGGWRIRMRDKHGNEWKMLENDTPYCDERIAEQHLMIYGDALKLKRIK